MSGASNRLPPPLSTTGIGSLPHTQRELAMQLALSVDIPFLPQLPQRSTAELMLPQALEGLPGMMFDNDGNISVDVETWQAARTQTESRLERVLSGDESLDPGAHHWAAWRPFVFDVADRELPFAKAQIAGPVTTRWALRTTDGEPASSVDGLEKQVLELILARALSMTRTLKATGTVPIFFLDEPGLFALNPSDPKQLVSVRELEVVVRALRNEGALVGLHCCSNTHWETILQLGLDYIAVDASLSLLPLVSAGPSFDAYVNGGGGLLLGIVPTNTQVGGGYYVTDLVDTSMAVLSHHANGGGVSVEQVLARTILSPACGLAMRSLTDCEQVFDDLRRARELLVGAVGVATSSSSG